jgi:hypothetical protein
MAGLGLLDGIHGERADCIRHTVMLGALNWGHRALFGSGGRWLSRGEGRFRRRHRDLPVAGS